MSDTGRTVVVAPPSSRRELIVVARAAFHIVFWSAVAIGVERGAGSRVAQPAATDRAPAPGEVALGDLPAAEQQVYRELRAAVPELERLRATSGAWPSVARWRVLREGTVTNYLGLPEASTGGSTFVLVFVEPEPGIPVDPGAVTDELHHRLADGTLLHVSIWNAPGARDLAAPLAAPAPEDGWRRVR